jgi:hypothetical protein
VIWWGNTKEREELEDLGIDARGFVLKLIFKKYNGKEWKD